MSVTDFNSVKKIGKNIENWTNLQSQFFQGQLTDGNTTSKENIKKMSNIASVSPLKLKRNNQIAKKVNFFETFFPHITEQWRNEKMKKFVEY